jgi:DNA-binding FadR family transcriptional regulator
VPSTLFVLADAHEDLRMPIKVIETKRLYQQIADQLSALITSGEFGVGQRLPSERDLAVQLGVSRPSLREALIALELEGMVEVRVGAGIWVTASFRPGAAKPHSDGEAPFELLRARSLIEGETAALAAHDATPSELAAIRATLTAMERAHTSGHGYAAADREFHVRIATATHNGVLHSVVLDLWDRGRGAIWKRMADHFETPELRGQVLCDHRAIYKALAEHDARAARSAMHAHLRSIEAEFARGWEQVQKEAPPRRSRPATAARSLRERG